MEMRARLIGRGLDDELDVLPQPLCFLAHSRGCLVLQHHQAEFLPKGLERVYAVSRLHSQLEVHHSSARLELIQALDGREDSRLTGIKGQDGMVPAWLAAPH